MTTKTAGMWSIFLVFFVFLLNEREFDAIVAEWSGVWVLMVVAKWALLVEI